MLTKPPKESFSSTKTDSPQDLSRREVLKTFGLTTGAGVVALSSGCSQTLGNTVDSSSETTVFFVAPDGNDHWSGTLATANQNVTDGAISHPADGPFATLERARDAVREYRRRSPEKDIQVFIRNGTYSLDKTVVFGIEDSGSNNAKVTYSAYPGEKPVFSSGTEITGWRKVTQHVPGMRTEAQGKLWVADVSERFFTLYDAEGMLPRARSAGFIPLEGGSKTALKFPEGRLKNWSNITDADIIVRPHHAWIVNILPLASVDEQAQIARTSTPATYAMNELHFLKGTESCWVENVLDELSSTGEWVLNTQEQKLYLWPRDGQIPQRIVAPQLSELIRVEGAIDKMGPKDIPVRNLHFRGLTFMHGERYQIEPSDAGLQHDWDFLDKDNALVRLRGTENCSIAGCRFAHSGSGAMRVDLHGQNNLISSNHIEHMGGGGILLCGYGPGSKDVNKRNLVTNNHIHHVGDIYSHAPPIMLWQSGDNRIANNLIHDTPYTGIIVSGFIDRFFEQASGRELANTTRWHEIDGGPGTRTWQQARPFLHTRNNQIEYNDIHHVMEKLGDGNGIYIRGAGAGNTIRRNYVHDLVTPMIMQAAIRTDGGQRDTLIGENLIYNCTSQGIIIKLNNRCENNVVIDVIAPPRGNYLSLREGPMTDAVIQRNIFYSSTTECTFIDELPPGENNNTEDRRGRVLARAKDADTDFNIYYCAADPTKGEMMLTKQHPDMVDLHSSSADPLFIDLANGNFQLRPDSPALKMGITPIVDIAKTGLTDANALLT